MSYYVEGEGLMSYYAASQQEATSIFSLCSDRLKNSILKSLREEKSEGEMRTECHTLLRCCKPL